uniref:Centrosomal protein 89 n=1 Tax=Scophthalmus maximus TaxID=52904 RepID=A0A8D3C3K5_SCOMX
AAILSSSLTGQTWALPPARPRSYSRVNNQSPSYLKRTSAKHLTPGNHPLENASDEEDREVEDEEDGDDHIYQTLDRGEPCPVTEPVYALPLKPKVGLVRKVLLLFKKPFCATCEVSKREKLFIDSISVMFLDRTKTQIRRTVLPGSQAELQGLRRHAQELVDENDALKLTVHRLNVELSHYQTHFRPLSKQESSKISGLPKIGSPPPWLLDMKYLSPLLLAYEDRMKEKDALLQTTEEDVKRLRVHVEEVIHENERLHNEIAKLGGVGQKDCHQIQKQAFLVLQENQVLIDQLEAQHVKAKANHSRHHSEVSKVSKQLMLLEAENQRLQEDLEESRREAQKNTRQIQDLQARLKNAITWDEHCNIMTVNSSFLSSSLICPWSFPLTPHTFFCPAFFPLNLLPSPPSFLLPPHCFLSPHLFPHYSLNSLSPIPFFSPISPSSRKAERRMSFLERQKDECVLEEGKTRHYLGAVISLAQHISQERDQLLYTASGLQQEKHGFVNRILNGTVRFGKLQEDVKVYRRQASTRLAALEEAAEGRTASYQRQILHLQRLLRERQEAEERLLAREGGEMVGGRRAEKGRRIGRDCVNEWRRRRRGKSVAMVCVCLYVCG